LAFTPAYAGERVSAFQVGKAASRAFTPAYAGERVSAFQVGKAASRAFTPAYAGCYKAVSLE